MVDSGGRVRCLCVCPNIFTSSIVLRAHNIGMQLPIRGVAVPGVTEDGVWATWIWLLQRRCLLVLLRVVGQDWTSGWPPKMSSFWRGYSVVLLVVTVLLYAAALMIIHENELALTSQSYAYALTHWTGCLKICAAITAHVSLALCTGDRRYAVCLSDGTALPEPLGAMHHKLHAPFIRYVDRTIVTYA